MSKTYRGYTKQQKYYKKNQYKQPKNPYKYQPEKQKRGELIFLALDSCIIIDIVELERKMQKGCAYSRLSPYQKHLLKLLDRSFYSNSGTRNPVGRIVLCLLPTVREEMSNEDGTLHLSVKEFIENRMLNFSIDEEKRPTFDKMISNMTSNYAKAGFLTTDEGIASMDAKICAESSIFNISLLSRDKHIVRNFRDKNPQAKIEKLKHINRRTLGGDFNNYQSEPITVGTVFKKMSEGEKFPGLQNFKALDNETQRIILKQKILKNHEAERYNDLYF